LRPKVQDQMLAMFYPATLTNNWKQSRRVNSANKRRPNSSGGAAARRIS